MKGLKRVALFPVIALMVASMAACGGTANKETGSSLMTMERDKPSNAEGAMEPNLTPVTLTAFQTLDMPQELMTSNVMKEITKKTGVTIDWVLGDDEKFNVLAASGGLPDIITYSGAVGGMRDLIKSGAIIQLDELLDKFGTNLKKRDAYTIKWQKVLYGDGKTYFLPTNTVINTTGKEQQNYNALYGMYARFDIYQAVGAPEFKGKDGLLDILKKMQDYARSRDGNKDVYAISGFYDWGFWPWTYLMMSFGGKEISATESISKITGEIKRSNEPGSDLWDILAWYNKAYRAGIVDPDSFIQKSDQFSAKVANGTCLTAPGCWFGLDRSVVTDPKAGLYFLPGVDTVYSIYQADNPLGDKDTSANAITHNCKAPERAMQFLDYLASDEGARTCLTGIKGVDWDYADGKPRLIGAKLEAVKTDTEPEYDKKNGVGFFQKYRPGVFLCDDGYPQCLTYMPEYEAIYAALGPAPAAENFVSAFDTRHEGLRKPGEVYEKWYREGKIQTDTRIFLLSSFMAPMSEEFSQIKNKVDNYLTDNLAAIIMARDDAAFAAVREKTIKANKAMGIDKYYAEYDRLLQEAQAAFDKVGDYK